MTNKQQRISGDGNNNMQIHHITVTGDLIINAYIDLTAIITIERPPVISNKQACNLRTIIRGIALLNSQNGCKDTQALLLEKISQATGAKTYKDIPASLYDTAVQTLKHYVHTRT
jgi:hypothetical protein